MTTWLQPAWDGLIDLVKAHVAWSPYIVFALGLAESIAFVSLFVPSTFLFIVIGGLHGAAGGSFLEVWLAGALGAAIGDVISFLAGRHFKHDVHRVWPFSRMPGLVPKARAMFERWGFWSILAGKFVGGLRPFIPVVAGMLDMPWLLFVAGSVVSSVIWAGTFLAPGYGVTLLPW
jgi:membrane protein DedA with SNARE-associated domain